MEVILRHDRTSRGERSVEYGRSEHVHQCTRLLLVVERRYCTRHRVHALVGFGCRV